MSWVSLNEGLGRPLHEAVKVKPGDFLGLPWRTQDVGVRYLPRKAATGRGTSRRERCVLESTKLKAVGDLKSIFTSDMEM